MGLLSTLIWLPIVGGLIILALGDRDLARRLRTHRRATEKRLLAAASGGNHAG